MKVFLKYISKNMFEKKGRLCLLIFSIAMSTALLVASTGLVKLIFDSFTKPYEQAQVSEIAITSATDDPFIDTAKLDTTDLKDLDLQIQIVGVMNENDKISYVQIHGKDAFDGKLDSGTNDFLTSYTEGSEPSCIISKRIADELGLETGSMIRIFLQGEDIVLKVKAVAVNDKLFYADTKNSFHMVVPYEYLNTRLDAGGKYNYIGANLTSGTAKKFVKAFNESQTDYTAYLLSAELEADASVTALLYAMMAIVVIVSAIIIHGVFKLIMTERLTVIGTFMSQGATKKKIEHMVLLEGLLYSVIGGIVGCVLGEVLLYFIGRLVSPLADYGVYAPFNIEPLHIVLGMVFAAVLSVLSAYTPVRSIRKYEVKDVILNRVEPKQKKKIAKLIVGIILLGFSIGVHVIIGKDEDPLTAVAMLTSFISIILLTPTVVKIIAGIIAKIFRKNTTVFLTMNNIRTSKLLRNNIVLIVVSLSAVLMISSFGESMTELVTGAYDDLKYDYSIDNIMENGSDTSTTDLIYEKLLSIDGIKKEDITSSGYNEAKIDGEIVYLSPTMNVMAFGRMMDKYSPIYTEHYDDLASFAASDDNELFLTTKISKAINKKKGDTVTVEYNNRKVEFTVAGVYDGRVYNNGLCIIIKSDVAKRTLNITEVSDFWFSLDGTRAAEDVEKDFKSFLASLGATYNTKAQDCKDNEESNAMLVNIMAIFSYLALIIASIGIFNNITISFHQRKKEFAVMSSVGMTKKKRKNMILTESMFSVVLSLLITTPFLILITGLFTDVTYFLGIAMITEVSWIAIPKFGLVIAAIIFLASLSTMRKSKKLSVVQELKYE